MPRATVPCCSGHHLHDHDIQGALLVPSDPQTIFFLFNRTGIIEARGHLSASEPQMLIARRLCSQHFLDLICPHRNLMVPIPLKAHFKERTRYAEVLRSAPNHTWIRGSKASECEDSPSLLLPTGLQPPRSGAAALPLPFPAFPPATEGCPPPSMPWEPRFPLQLTPSWQFLWTVTPLQTPCSLVDPSATFPHGIAVSQR